jgi:ATP-dependent Clp protease adaptor protein ClpS
MTDKKDKPVWEEGVAIKERQQVKKPRRFKVLLHNDDYTTMEFVIRVLVEVFRKSETEATQIMLHVHTKGSGVCGVYTYDLAQTKVHQVTQLSRRNEMPLKCTMEAE